MMGWLDDTPKPFLSHVHDMRKALIGIMIAWACGIVLAIPLSPYVLRLLQQPFTLAGMRSDEWLRVIGATEGLNVLVRCVMWLGFGVALPVIVFFLMRFFVPGMTPRERRWVRGLSISAFFLFVAGVAMGFFVTLPVALNVILRINNWAGFVVEFFSVSSYYTMAIKLLLAFGLVFELPILLLSLGLLGIVSSKTLASKRKHVVIGVFTLAMVLTPPDAITQTIMALPMLCFYELCIWLIWGLERARRGR